MVFSGARRFGFLLARGRVRAVALFAAAAVILGVGLSAPAKGHGRVLSATGTASGTFPGRFQAVAATSARDVWAVGSTNDHSLIAHWKGAAWATVPSPSAGSLNGVAAVSASDAWAVGSSATGTLVEHWNGTAWMVQKTPHPSGSRLIAVAATSARNAWAVGAVGSAPNGRALILHWHAGVWTRTLGPAGQLSGVAASSPSNAWAVGYTPKGHTLILHWHGGVWSRVPSPPRNPEGVTDMLNGVAIGPGNAAWAVGEINCDCGPGGPLIERWNGRSWRQVVRIRGLRNGAYLTRVTSIGARDAWVVGATGKRQFGLLRTAILRWTGHAWRQVASPSPEPSAFLSGLAFVSRRDGWAVGYGTNRNGTHPKTVVLHWNGKVWK